MATAQGDDEAASVKVVTTEDHPYWNATDGRFEELQDFDHGDVVSGEAGTTLRYAGLDASTTRVAIVYNLTVSDVHTYLVTSDAILVHNCKGGVYSMRDPETDAVVRTGRSKDLQSRESAHGRDAELAGYRFQVGYRTDVYEEQRGLEDLLYNRHPEAQKANGGLNKIRAISPLNPRGSTYRKAATNYLQGNGG